MRETYVVWILVKWKIFQTGKFKLLFYYWLPIKDFQQRGDMIELYFWKISLEAIFRVEVIYGAMS